MFEHANRIAQCDFTSHALRAAGMSTRDKRENKELLRPVEDALGVIPGDLLGLLEEANRGGGRRATDACVKAHELLKEHDIYFWIHQPGKPIVGLIEASSPIPETDASVHAVWIFREEHAESMEDLNGQTSFSKEHLLEPTVFRHRYNILSHAEKAHYLETRTPRAVDVNWKKKSFVDKASIVGVQAYNDDLWRNENELLLTTLSELGATDFLSIRSVFENDTAMHEAQHYLDIQSHLAFGHMPEKRELEYGAYIINLAHSPVKQYLLAQHIRKHYVGESERKGIDSKIIDAYMKELDFSRPIDLFGLEESIIAEVAESLLAEHYGIDGYCRKRDYF